MFSNSPPIFLSGCLKLLSMYFAWLIITWNLDSSITWTNILLQWKRFEIATSNIELLEVDVLSMSFCPLCSILCQLIMYRISNKLSHPNTAAPGGEHNTVWWEEQILQAVKHSKNEKNVHKCLLQKSLCVGAYLQQLYTYLLSALS